VENQLQLYTRDKSIDLSAFCLECALVERVERSAHGRLGTDI